MGDCDKQENGVAGAGKMEAGAEKYLCEQLVDDSNSICDRFRALFSLRNVNTPMARRALVTTTRDSSNLLAHEAAFALGQMRHPDSIPALESALSDPSLHPIVRHEAAEALAALPSPSSLPLLLNSSLLDPSIEVRQTCQLALFRFRDISTNNSYQNSVSPFFSVDPALPASSSSVEDLRGVLLDEEQSLYHRYASLFALRDFGGDDAVASVIESLRAESALLRHEVAYVLGQIQNKAASAALTKVLRDTGEHPMVRHEAAEALGSIADCQSIEVLREFMGDPEPIVSQSCEVALTMLEFERSGRSFEYLFTKDPLIHL